MTRIEYILALVVIAAVLGALVMVSSSLRADTAQRHTRHTLELLRAALLRYHDLRHDVPPSPTGVALATLFADSAVAPMLESVSILRGPDAAVVVLDGFGHPVHYQRPQAAADLRTADFVSPGPDGQLGDPHSPLAQHRRAAMDNLLGADTERPRP